MPSSPRWPHPLVARGAGAGLIDQGVGNPGGSSAVDRESAIKAAMTVRSTPRITPKKNRM